MFNWFKKADTGSESSGGTSSTRPTKAEIDEVAGYLSEWQSVCEGQRWVSVQLPKDSALGHAIREKVDVAASTDYHSKRSREIEELMELYGDAVRRVPGADPQDLYFLASMSMIKQPTR